MDGGLREFASLPTSVSYILRVDAEYKSKVFPCFLEWPAEMFRFGVFLAVWWNISPGHSRSMGKKYLQWTGILMKSNYDGPLRPPVTSCDLRAFYKDIFFVCLCS